MLANVPNDTPESVSDDRLASDERGASFAGIVTVTVPTLEPSCVAVTVTVSADSCSSSSTAVNVAEAERDPAARVSVVPDSV